MTSTPLHGRARVAALTRHRAPDDPDLLAAHRQLREDVLRAHIDRALDAEPPLTADQRGRLARRLLDAGPAPGGTR